MDFGIFKGMSMRLAISLHLVKADLYFGVLVIDVLLQCWVKLIGVFS